MAWLRIFAMLAVISLAGCGTTSNFGTESLAAVCERWRDGVIRPSRSDSDESAAVADLNRRNYNDICKDDL